MPFFQGWEAGAGAGRNRLFLTPWSRSRFIKKTGAGAGAGPKKNQEPEPEPPKMCGSLKLNDIKYNIEYIFMFKKKKVGFFSFTIISKYIDVFIFLLYINHYLGDPTTSMEGNIIF